MIYHGVMSDSGTKSEVHALVKLGGSCYSPHLAGCLTLHLGQLIRTSHMACSYTGSEATGFTAESEPIEVPYRQRTVLSEAVVGNKMIQCILVAV